MSAGRRNLQPVLGPTPEDLVAADHPYRRLLKLVPFTELCAPLLKKYSHLGRSGYVAESMFKALVLQWMEDLSFRELERFLKENLAAKLFCGFGLTDETPDFTTLCTFRSRLGTDGVTELFAEVDRSLRSAGLVREVFTFVDATHLISKANLWSERDRLIREGEEKLSNQNVARVANDQEARLGRKGPLKWFGFKIHAAVDMSQGFITKVFVTAANVEDTKAARFVMPEQGMVFGDKAYGVGDSAKAMRERGLHSGAILKNDMLAKNPDKDRWLSSVRMPYEGTFSRFRKRARYVGEQKCQFQAVMQALAHNFKRMLALDIPPLFLRPQCA
jgi:IS5 family transposase